MGAGKEFLDFLREYNVLALAIAFMIGTAANDLVQSLVNSVIMPFVSPFIPGMWEEATLHLGPVNILWGEFTSVLLNFAIIALVVFFVAKKILKEKKVGKK